MPTRELHIAAFAVVALACVTPRRRKALTASVDQRTPAEIAGWNIDIDRYGKQPSAGRAAASVMAARSSINMRGLCHGAQGAGRVGGVTADALVGGQARLATRQSRENRRQLLALRPDIVRLHPPRHAAKRAAIATHNDDVYARVSGLHP